MMSISYAIRKANRQTTAGAAERAYADMRGALENHLQGSPPQNGRFVEVITGEQRLREALSQRVPLCQVLDVMEQRWPYPAQRIALVRRIARAVGTVQLNTALDEMERRYGLVRAAPAPAPPSAPPVEPSSVSVQPSMSTQPSLPPPPCARPAPPMEAAPSTEMERRRQIVISNLSTLTRPRWRDLAFELRLTVGCVDELERPSGSNREAVRRMLQEYFNTPRFHRGDQFGTLIRALRELNLNMTADRLTDELQW